METAMDNSTSMTTPPEEVDKLIQMVADEAGLQVAGLLDSAGTASHQVDVHNSETQSVASDDFESRLAALRR